VPASELRTFDELRRHYEVEKDLARRLRNAERAERHGLYGSVYDELFRRVPSHPQLTRKAAPEAAAAAIAAQVRMLRPFLRRASAFLEIGAGDCALSIAVAADVRQVHAVDVSAAIVEDVQLPANVAVHVTTGTDIPLARETIDVAYSNQLMEHLHPDDADEQLRNIHACLKPSGMYLCVTPNRLTGPHDISAYFADEPMGFHLKEYTVGDLDKTFRAAGFSSVGVLVGARGRFQAITPFPIVLMEALLGRVPLQSRRTLAHRLRLNALLGIRLLGRR
jgi:2-polyprenyl-3-methyl-5-hydroxy-6-metoxy-1,4-benzoquinol methylase